MTFRGTRLEARLHSYLYGQVTRGVKFITEPRFVSTGLLQHEYRNEHIGAVYNGHEGLELNTLQTGCRRHLGLIVFLMFTIVWIFTLYNLNFEVEVVFVKVALTVTKS